MTAPQPGIAEIEDTLHAVACQATGLDDFGDGGYTAGLRALLESCVEDAGIADVMQSLPGQMAVGALVGRLLAEQGWRNHPEWQIVPAERPIIIVGMVRTATTALHRLLAEDPAAQGPEYWLLRFPQPRPPRDTWGTNPGFQACDQALSGLYQVDPDFKGLHDIQAHLVDECYPLLQQSFLSSLYEFVFPALTGYRAWLADQDATRAYERHRDLIRLIFSNAPDRRWVLKCPTHVFSPEALFNVYPDALIVQTHRHPRKTIPSGCSVVSRFRRAVGDTIEPDFGTSQVEIWSRAVNRFTAARAERPASQFFDVHVGDFARDPLGILRDLYEHFELELTHDAEQRMKEWLAANPGGGHGRHEYRADDFGIEEGFIDEAFAPYIDAFGLAERG